jgi:riboflavin kinase/FMN adenylyltransferase
LKKILLVIALLIVILGGATYWFFDNLDSFIKNYMVEYGSKMTQTDFEVHSVKTDLKKGEITINRIGIENPKGFSNSEAFEVEKVSVIIKKESLNQNVVEIPLVIIKNPEIIYEYNGKKTNFDVLKNNIQAKQVIIGNDFRFGARREGDVKSLMKDGINVCVMEKIQDNGERISSTMVRDLLANGDLERATNILGRPYAISGKVVHGDKRGRELGFPTANIHMFHNRPPLKGVFAVKLNGMSGVANLGTRPTITGISKLNLEVHLFDFSEDLYGKHAKVIFLQKVRDEKKFRNIEALKEQIKIDIKKAKIFLEDYDRRQ